jgi:hypothetical protein
VPKGRHNRHCIVGLQDEVAVCECTGKKVRTTVHIPFLLIYINSVRNLYQVTCLVVLFYEWIVCLQIFVSCLC